MAAVNASTSVPSKEPWSETALDWLLRSQRLQANAAVPHDPPSVAWAFCRPFKRNGTGIAYMDAALSKQHNSPNLPVVEIRGGHHTGKTWTLLTLAAKFVTSTRPSRFEQDNETPIQNLPQVVILDSNLDTLPHRLLHCVRSALLRESPESMPDDSVQQELTSCLSRIHFVFQDAAGWIPILESLRFRLASLEHPTLVLWDGFLGDVGDVAGRMEIIRQVSRLLQDANVFLVTTTTTTGVRAWDKHVTRRVVLAKQNPVPDGGHDYMARTGDAQIPFSITSGGVLC